MEETKRARFEFCSELLNFVITDSECQSGAWWGGEWRFQALFCAETIEKPSWRLLAGKPCNREIAEYLCVYGTISWSLTFKSDV